MMSRRAYGLTALPLAALAAALALTPTGAAAQFPGQPVGVGAGQPGQQPVDQIPDDGIDVLAKGPVHEAYAATVEQPNPETQFAPKAPPEPIEELPPDQKPEGDNVQWIPGYWDYDDERNDFIWVSGFWRVPPPGRVWVPGGWRQTVNGWQWVSGFWQQLAVEQPGVEAEQPQIEYLPQPPQTLETGPVIPPPLETSVYVPGCWVWRGRYLWRPGVWIDFRPGWVWIPAHFRWTPIGYVFVDGYWDYPLESRGVVFAPVYFHNRVIVQPTFVYTPVYVVPQPVLIGALFVRPGAGYCFGDYFDGRYARRGFHPWCRRDLPGAVIAVGPGRHWNCDPLWSYYRVDFRRRNPAIAVSVTNLYVGRFNGDIPRPPVTLRQQNNVIQNVTRVNNINNATNNITVVNNNITVNNTNVTNNVMVTPLKTTAQLQPAANLKPITADARKQEQANARDIRQVAVQRRNLENAVAEQQPRPKVEPKSNPKIDPKVDSKTTPKVEPKIAPVQNTQPVSVKLNVPRTQINKAVVKDEAKAPPPVAIKPLPGVTPKVEPKNSPLPKVEPKATPKIDPKPLPKVDTKVDPKPLPKVDTKVDLKPLPKVEPLPKIDPKPLPKVEPKPLPKADPIPVPKVDPKPFPKVEPLPKFDPKPLPKVEPKPVLLPKVEPKPLPPLNPNPVPLPKVEPRPLPVPVQPKPLPVPQPKVEPRPLPVQPKPLPVPVQPKPLPVPVQPKPLSVPQPKVEPRPLPQPQPKIEPKKDGRPRKM